MQGRVDDNKKAHLFLFFCGTCSYRTCSFSTEMEETTFPVLLFLNPEEQALLPGRDSLAEKRKQRCDEIIRRAKSYLPLNDLPCLAAHLITVEHPEDLDNGRHGLSYIQQELLKVGIDSKRNDGSSRCDENVYPCDCDGRHYHTQIAIWPADRHWLARPLTYTCLGAFISCCCFCNCC